MRLKKSKSSPFSTGSKQAKTVQQKAKRFKNNTEDASKWVLINSDSLLRATNPEDNSIHRPRMIQAAGFTLLLVMVLFGSKLFALQVTDGNRYRELANGNRVREVVEYAERGTIFDRNGKPLTETTIGYQVSVSPYQLPDNVDERQVIYRTLSSQLGETVKDIEQRIEKQGLDYVLPIAIGEIVDQDTALTLEQLAESQNGINVSVVPQRSYVSDSGLGHILGYIGLVNEDDIANRRDVSLVDYVGRSGIEQQYDNILRGKNGFKRYEVDALGQPIRLIASAPAESGTDIYLTIDYQLQQSLAREVKAQADAAPSKRGSGVVVEPESGEVLAMVSYPWYDNNLFSGGISFSDYARLVNDPNQPLYNKVTAGGYPSGSIIKTLVAAAGLEEGVVDENTIIVDNGYLIIPNQFGGGGFRFNGWNLSGLGPMNVRRAIAMSSNIYFYTVGGGHGSIEGLGPERLTNYYKNFGLGELTGIDLPSEQPGRVPTPEWKKQFSGEDWYQGDTYNISIGQGDILVSPLQITMANNAIVNDGYVLQPRLLMRTADEVETRERVVRRKINVSHDNLQIVREGMHEVPYRGATGSWRFAKVPVPFAGKSGTAETKSTQSQKTANHGWFTAYAPYENPELTMTILIEQAGSGSATAAPAVANVLEYYFTRPQNQDSNTLSVDY